jgi:L-ascorbate metabolism protein UlaG (beta-lactamase superfamily)
LRSNIGAALRDALAIDAVVDPHQFLPRCDILEILHQHRGHIAANLRRDDRRLAAHIGIVGRLAVRSEGR